MSKPRVIAFYLPQFHPTPHNDEWWGKGFTEWTNVARAKPLFRGHEQPHIPGELGFYDLRLPQVREAQAELARDYGIYGFCYYYYRFEKGKNELELPLNEVLKTGKPNFPFMICWANETWHKKFWQYDGTSEKKVLIEQKYNGIEDYTAFFYEVLPYFKDRRYIRINGKPAFMIYRPNLVPNVKDFINVWNMLAKENGLEGVYFIGYTMVDSDIISSSQGENVKWRDVFKNSTIMPDVKKDRNQLIECGFDSVALNRFFMFINEKNLIKRVIKKIIRSVFHRPNVFQYKDVVKCLVGAEDLEEDIYPVVMPNWDHTPRSNYGGRVWQNSTPKLYEEYLYNVLQSISQKKEENQIVFLKSWNEWGEGNYLEPDLKWGRQYLEANKRAIEKFYRS